MLPKSRLKFYQWPIALIRKILPNTKRRSINNPQIIDSEYCHGIHFGPREKSQSGIDRLHHLLIAYCAHGSSSATPGGRWSKQIQLIIRAHLPISPWSFWIIQYPKTIETLVLITLFHGAMSFCWAAGRISWAQACLEYFYGFLWSYNEIHLASVFRKSQLFCTLYIQEWQQFEHLCS